MIKHHAVANFGGFADYYTHAMVDEKPPTNLGTWVNLNTGKKPR